MPETVELLTQDKVILVNSYGDTNIEEWIQSRQKVETLVRETGITSILIDTRQQTATPSTVDILNFGASLPLNMDFAIILSTATQEDQRFLETVGKNRAKSIQVFEDYAQALSWLNDQRNHN